MARQKRNSAALERAKRRFESLRSISTTLDLGGELTIRNFAAAIQELDNKLAAYNTSLSEVDKQADDVKVSEKAVTALSEKMLLGVGSLYGKTSQEYEMAGGRRRKSGGAPLKAKASQPTMAKAVEPQTSNGTVATSGV